MTTALPVCPTCTRLEPETRTGRQPASAELPDEFSREWKQACEAESSEAPVEPEPRQDDPPLVVLTWVETSLPPPDPLPAQLSEPLPEDGITGVETVLPTALPSPVVKPDELSGEVTPFEGETEVSDLHLTEFGPAPEPPSAELVPNLVQVPASANRLPAEPLETASALPEMLQPEPSGEIAAPERPAARPVSRFAAQPSIELKLHGGESGSRVQPESPRVPPESETQSSLPWLKPVPRSEPLAPRNPGARDAALPGGAFAEAPASRPAPASSASAVSGVTTTVASIEPTHVTRSTPSVQDIEVRLQGVGELQAVLRVSDRQGYFRVTVHSTNAELNHDLKSGVDHLANRLAAVGYKIEVGQSPTAVRAASAPRESQPEFDGYGRDRSKRQHSQQEEESL